jgi:dihydroorotase
LVRKVPHYQKIRFQKLFIKGGRLIIPGCKITLNPGIYIDRGRIVKPFALNCSQILILELKDSEYLSPGFIDLHAHLREPGNSESETIARGTLSAVAGGFCEVLCMPNTYPPVDRGSLVRYLINQGKKADNAKLLVIGAATKNRAGKELVSVEELRKAGVVALSDDGLPIGNDKLMYELLLLSREFNLPIINHCEVLALSKGGVINDGKIARKLGLPGIPDIAESIMVLRDIVLQERTQGILHLAHISTEKSVKIIRWAKKQGIRVSCETTPHYFTLTEEHCRHLDPYYKVSPPLRSKRDVEAIKEGLVDGTIDIIATDHAPWHMRYKKVPWIKARPGIIGFETAFSLGYEELVLKKYLSLENYIACLTQKPRKLIGRSLLVKEGDLALITIFDLAQNWLYREDRIFSRSVNSPFINKELKGKVTKVIIENKLFIF